MKTIISIFVSFSILFMLFACKFNKNELQADDAILIAIQTAKASNFNISKSDIEAIRVKDGYEKGPMRLVSIIRYFPKEKHKSLLSNEYWIVYFYPKGTLEKPGLLGGGEFYVLIELHTGKVLESFKGS